MSARPTQPVLPILDPRQRRAILITVCIALMAVIASVSGLSVAQPELAAEFGASQAEVLWFINIYAISLAALLLPLGAMGDRLGRRPILLLGLLVFGIANIGAGLATSSEMMLVARFASGIGAAMIMPITLAVITSTFPEDERSKAIGIWTGVAGGGGIAGMYVSALMVDVATWRWLFALPVVLVLLAGIMAIRSIPNSHESTEHRFDIAGALASMAAIGGVTLALHEGPERGWLSPVALLSLIAGVAAVIGFVVVELRSIAPLLDVRLFRDRRLSSGSISLLTVYGVQAGVFVVMFPFFQAVVGWSALRSTLALMPMALMMMFASGLAPRLTHRFEHRTLMAIGIFVTGAGLLLMATRVSVDGGYCAVLPGMIAMGFGMGLMMTPSTESITSALPRERQGVASALNDVTRELGVAVGVALLGSVLASGYRNSMSNRVTSFPEGIAATATDGIGNALAVADQAGPHSGALVRFAQESFVTGWQLSMLIGSGAMALLFIFVVVRGPRRTLPGTEPGQAG